MSTREYVNNTVREARRQALTSDEERLLKTAGLSVKNGDVRYVLVRLKGKQVRAEPLSIPSDMQPQTGG